MMSLELPVYYFLLLLCSLVCLCSLTNHSFINFESCAEKIARIEQTCTTQKARRAKLSTCICSGPQLSISFRCRDFIVVWKKLQNDNYLFEVELLQHFLQLRKLSRCRPQEKLSWGACCAGLELSPYMGCKNFKEQSLR